MNAHRKGAALGLVLVALLIMTLLASTLARMPGNAKRLIPCFENRNQEIYNQISAIIAKIERFPHDYFKQTPWNLELPDVTIWDAAPWHKIEAERVFQNQVFAMVGARYRKMSKSEIRDVVEQEMGNLNRMILERGTLLQKSGNRRFSGKVKQMDLLLTDGDLTLDFDGIVLSGNFKCDGTVNVRGNAVYDTLRIYGKGPVNLSGMVEVKHLEIYSGDHVVVGGTVAFSGVIISKGNVEIGKSSVMKYPAVAMSSEGDVFLQTNSRGGVPGGTVFSPGVCADTLGVRIPVVSVRGDDRQECLLPAVAQGRMVAFRWGMK